MINKEFIQFEGLKVYGWGVEPEYFSDILVSRIFEGPDDGILYALLIDKPRVDGLNDHISNMSDEDGIGRECGFDEDDIVATAYPVTWLKRVLNELELKTMEESRRDAIFMNVSAIEGLEEYYLKENK